MEMTVGEPTDDNRVRIFMEKQRGRKKKVWGKNRPIIYISENVRFEL